MESLGVTTALITGMRGWEEGHDQAYIMVMGMMGEHVTRCGHHSHSSRVWQGNYGEYHGGDPTRDRLGIKLENMVPCFTAVILVRIIFIKIITSVMQHMITEKSDFGGLRGIMTQITGVIMGDSLDECKICTPRPWFLKISLPLFIPLVITGVICVFRKFHFVKLV